MNFDIIRAGHCELLVSDLNKAYDFYVDALGFKLVYEDSEFLYLRGHEERFHHSLVLAKFNRGGCHHIAYRVRSNEDLVALESFLKNRGLEVFWVEKGHELGMGKAIRVQDPLGFPIEFYSEMEKVEWSLQRYHEYRGAKILRLDHFNIHTHDVERALDWYKSLGFVVTEITETEDIPPKIWAAWLRRKHTSHDIALTNGYGPRLHHVAFSVPDRLAILDAADILASRNYISNMERGPGRHGITNAFFFYLRDPDGNRIELYTGDYLSADPDWDPIVWKFNDPKRQTLWGMPAPRSWFEESSPVVDFKTGNLKPLNKPLLQEKPSYVTH
ncbi:MAG TPA: 3,4-dihydroxyphenylacetate 2,3-dioxygenase [Geobacterales bacterium]|nr:3,4-dihydroxyphenylacetate 2,3-dioxygenase [Geobacterales bacterium]